MKEVNERGKRMKYLSVNEIAKQWKISERSVRNYCANGRVPGAFLKGKTWNIPADAIKPDRINKKREGNNTLKDILKSEKRKNYSGGIYHKTQFELTYHSNRLEGNPLTYDQIMYILDTNTIEVTNVALNVDDVVETMNHFRCVDMIIEHVNATLSETFIKSLHTLLKSGSSDSRKDWFEIGDYKKAQNKNGEILTVLPEDVPLEMKKLILEYNMIESKTLDDILEFHVRFERIHPFQDGNGRIGRLIIFKECLKYKIIPFIVESNQKSNYYKGMNEWDRNKDYLKKICMMDQDKYKSYLDYFRIG